jgi:hypothetical protein
LGLSVDDGGRLLIDGKQIASDWNVHGVVHISGEVELSEGSHEIKVEYFQFDGGAECKLVWALKGSFDETLVPASTLWHDAKFKLPVKK